jgi:hypothetical protein
MPTGKVVGEATPEVAYVAAESMSDSVVQGEGLLKGEGWGKTVTSLSRKAPGWNAVEATEAVVGGEKVLPRPAELAAPDVVTPETSNACIEKAPEQPGAQGRENVAVTVSGPLDARVEYSIAAARPPGEVLFVCVNEEPRESEKVFSGLTVPKDSPTTTTSPLATFAGKVAWSVQVEVPQARNALLVWTTDEVAACAAGIEPTPRRTVRPMRRATAVAALRGRFLLMPNRDTAFLARVRI